MPSASAGRERPSHVRRAGSDVCARAPMRWVAEAIAEQNSSGTCASRPRPASTILTTCTESEAVTVLRFHLTRDLGKHRRWLAISIRAHGASFGVVLFAIPGPNIVGYYFAFRVVGHYLSFRGARQGLNAVAWTHEPSAPLSELRRLLAVAPGVREPRVHAVQETLRLEHLVSFFERSAVST